MNFKSYLRSKRFNATHIERNVDPTVTDDIYRLGTMWVNLTTQRVWVCTDTTKGAAIWTEVDDIDQLITDLAALEARVTVNEGDILTNQGNIAQNAADILTNAGNISTNASDISDLQGALGSVDEASINYSSNNYITDGEDLVTSAGKLDTEAKAVSDRVTVNEGVIATLGTAAFEDIGTAAGEIPQLDGSGKLPTSTIPALALSEIYVVADITARDALTVQEGDVAKVTADPTPTNNRSYIYDGSSWIDLHPSYIAADEISYDNSTSGATSTNLQDLGDELYGLIGGVSGFTEFFVDLNAAGGGTGSKNSPFNSIDDVATARNAIASENVIIYVFSTGATVTDTQTIGFSSSSGPSVITKIIGIGNDTNGKPRMQWDDFTGDGDEYYFLNLDLTGTASFDSTGDTRVIFDRCIIHGQGTNSFGDYIIKQGWIGADPDNGVATEAGLRFGTWTIEGPVGVDIGVTAILLSATLVNIHNVSVSIPIDVSSASGNVAIYNSSIVGKIEISSGASLGIYNSEINEIELIAASTATLVSRSSRIQILSSSTATGTITLSSNSFVDAYTNTSGTTITLDETSGILYHTENNDSTVPLTVSTYDIDSLYERGSFWINENKAYVCTDNSSGASRWRHIAQDRYQSVSIQAGTTPNVRFEYSNRGSAVIFNPSDNNAVIILDTSTAFNLENGDWIDYHVVGGVTVTSSYAGSASFLGSDPLAGGYPFTRNGIVRVTLVSLNAYMITILGS